MCVVFFVQESCRKEREIMSRQHDEDKVEQKKSERRMNRWYNRLLNRHQDDPVSYVFMSVCVLMSFHTHTHTHLHVHTHIHTYTV